MVFTLVRHLLFVSIQANSEREKIIEKIEKAGLAFSRKGACVAWQQGVDPDVAKVCFI